ncbi:MAG TPA: hypothetical protein VI653_24240, partial [Steroidobacteraceae bacterium]
MGRDRNAAGATAAARILIGALGLATHTVVQAQTATQTVPASAADPQPVLEEVVITATGTNISGITPVGSEELSLSRDDILN